jgi:hypothetical protein
MISSSTILTILLHIVTAATASSSSSDHYTLEWGPQVGNSFPFSSIETNSGRSLQTKDSLCAAKEKRFICTTESVIEEKAADGASNKSYTLLTIQTECDFALENQFNFRKATNCICEANVHRVLQDGTSPPDKVCPCAVCAEGFGDAPVAIDCTEWEAYSSNSTNGTTTTGDDDAGNSTTVDAGNSTTAVQSAEQIDSLVSSQCSSLDCGLSCNGTCRLDCANSDSSCKFCQNNPANLPNGTAVTNRTDDPLANFDGKPISEAGTKSGATFVKYCITYALASFGLVYVSLM